MVRPSCIGVDHTGAISADLRDIQSDLTEGSFDDDYFYFIDRVSVDAYSTPQAGALSR